jgi:MHS family proline/betaine transporter-like MFS transporter
MSHLDTKGIRRTTFGTFIGTALEQHDFAIYTHLLVIIAPLCFPAEDAMGIRMKGFFSFALGSLFRPFGGLLFGHIGDRFGRKKALLISISLMSVPTLLIGSLPGYAQIGAASGFLLYFYRSLQSISIGGELAGSGTILAENAPLNRKYLYCSFSSVAFWIGGILGAISGWFFIRPFMPVWGWRISFFLGSFIALVGIYIRSKGVETPEFALVVEQNKILKFPFLETLKKDWRSHICYTGMMLGAGNISSILMLYVPMIMRNHFGYSVSDALMITIFFMSIMVISYPLSGLLADRMGGKKLMVFAIVLVAGLMSFVHRAAEFHSPFYLFLCQGLACMVYTAQVAPMNVISKYMYPTERRYSGSSFGQGIGAALGSGCAPLILTFLKNQTDGFWGPCLYVICTQCIALLCLYFAPNFLKKPD